MFGNKITEGAKRNIAVLATRRKKIIFITTHLERLNVHNQRL